MPDNLRLPGVPVQTGASEITIAENKSAACLLDGRAIQMTFIVIKVKGIVTDKFLVCVEQV